MNKIEDLVVGPRAPALLRIRSVLERGNCGNQLVLNICQMSVWNTVRWILYISEIRFLLMMSPHESTLTRGRHCEIWCIPTHPNKPRKRYQSQPAVPRDSGRILWSHEAGGRVIRAVRFSAFSRCIDEVTVCECHKRQNTVVGGAAHGRSQITVRYG